MIRKIQLLFISTLLFSVHLYGQPYNKQNTYIDALELKSIYSQNIVEANVNNDLAYDDFYKILLKYGIDESNIESNIFLKGLAIQRNPLALANDGSLVPRDLPYQQPDIQPASLSGLNWQASAINGLANFMAGRFKQEGLQVAIDQIFKQIKDRQDSVIVNAIFPRTFKQIGHLYKGSSYYTADLLLLRQTAQMDIEQLPGNMIKNSEVLFSYLKTKPEIRDMMLLGSYLVEYSQQGQSLDQLLSSLANETYSSDSTIYEILNVADLLSQALLDKNGSKDIWVNPLKILPASADSLKSPGIRFFYGLLYQQLIQIPEFKSYLASQDSGNVVSIAAKIQDLLRFVNKLKDTYSYIQSKGFNLRSPEEIIRYLTDINQSLNTFALTLKKVPELNRHYVLNDAILDASGRYLTIAEALIQKDYQKVIPLLIVQFGEYLPEKVTSTRTIVFLSQLATLKNAEDMEALLSSYALPIGSSSIKRNSKFNISVNGYVGFTGGWETAYGDLKNQTKGNIGLSAPIGISATVANGYLTPFISFLDLGSVVNQRLNNDNTSFSNLKFEHFFTPGLGLFVNFPKLPLTAGAHLNYISNLRTIKYESAEVTETNRSVTRLNFSVLVDIPFFTLYNNDKVN